MREKALRLTLAALVDAVAVYVFAHIVGTEFRVETESVNSAKAGPKKG